MERFVGLLRGINVGRAKRIAMADLRDSIAELGYGDVLTLLNSGNVVFRPRTSKEKPETAASRIEAAIEKDLGVVSRMTAIRASELADAHAANPFAKLDIEPARYLLATLRRPEDAVLLEPIVAKDWGADQIVVRGRFAYLACYSGILESKLAAAVDKTYRDACTMRNWTTATKLLALALV